MQDKGSKNLGYSYLQSKKKQNLQIPEVILIQNILKTRNVSLCTQPEMHFSK